MTAHQDVAGVVERLLKHVQDRGGFAKDDNGVPVGTAWPMMLESATLIESLSKALSEAEVDKAVKERGIAESARLAHKLMIRALAAESRLAEAMKVIEPFARLAALYDGERNSGNKIGWIDFISDYAWPSQEQCRAANTFLNAGKE